MVDSSIKLPGSSLEELSKIIAAYSNVDGEASPPDVAKLASVDPTTISRNNAFLTQVGLLETHKAAKKSVTPLGRDLGRAIDHNLSDRVQELWREVVTRSDFLRQLVTAVRIRKGMEPSAFVAHVGYSAGLPKGTRTSTGARTVLSILVASGLVGSSEGRIIALAPIEAQPSSPQPAPAQTDAPTSPNRPLAQPPVPFPGAVPLAATIAVQVNITASPSDLPALGQQIRSLLDALRPDEVSVTVDGDIGFDN